VESWIDGIGYCIDYWNGGVKLVGDSIDWIAVNAPGQLDEDKERTRRVREWKIVTSLASDQRFGSGIGRNTRLVSSQSAG
jgi:hypothetical protein